MTKNEVMQMALDVFTNKRYARASAARSASVVSLIDALALAKVTEANKELRAALAQPEKECSRVECGGNNGCIDICWKKKPQRKEWVGLTDEEVVNRANAEVFAEAFARGVAWAELKLKEKNT